MSTRRSARSNSSSSSSSRVAADATADVGGDNEPALQQANKKLRRGAHPAAAVARKRQQGGDEEDDNDEDAAEQFNFANVPHKFDPVAYTFKINQNDLYKWESVDEAARNLCIKAVARLFLFKGSRREIIKQSQVQDALEKLDKNYRKLANAVLVHVQRQLFNAMGYVIVSTENIIGAKGLVPKAGTTSEYFLTNGLQDPQLLKILNNACLNPSYQAFMIVVLLAIYTAPQRKLQVRDILTYVRQIDPRFPASIPANSKVSGSTSGGVGELAADFLGLIHQMKKEKYIILDKEGGAAGAGAGAGAVEAVGNDVGQHTYVLGPRFYVDIGKKQLLRCYFAVTGTPEDAKIMTELDEEERGQLQEGRAAAAAATVGDGDDDEA